MIVLVTDFGMEGPYVGQMKNVLCQKIPDVPVIDLFSNLPSFDIQAAAYLLAAYVNEFPEGTIFLCVIDPGVGSDRRAALVQADGRWYVGPDNGLFNVIAQRAKVLKWWDIVWRPMKLSASFHGRDLFAPVAARLAQGRMPDVELQDPSMRVDNDWPEELNKVVYIDHFGNVMTGIRAASSSKDAVLEVAGHRLSFARTFSNVEEGKRLWYENSNGLVEVAVNQGHAATELGIVVGDEVAWL